MEVLSRFIKLEGKRIDVTEIHSYHPDAASRARLRIYIPFNNATFDQCDALMNIYAEIEEWGVVRNDDGTEVEQLITVHKNYTKSGSLELNTDEMYPNHWMIDLVRRSETEIIAIKNEEMNQVNELALLDVYESMLTPFTGDQDTSTDQDDVSDVDQQDSTESDIEQQ